MSIGRQFAVCSQLYYPGKKKKGEPSKNFIKGEDRHPEAIKSWITRGGKKGKSDAPIKATRCGGIPTRVRGTPLNLSFFLIHSCGEFLGGGFLEGESKATISTLGYRWVSPWTGGDSYAVPGNQRARFTLGGRGAASPPQARGKMRIDSGRDKGKGGRKAFIYPTQKQREAKQRFRKLSYPRL